MNNLSAAMKQAADGDLSDVTLAARLENTPLCSGSGKYHSDGGKKPRQLETITLANLDALLVMPQSNAPKDTAQWAIFSDLLTRSHDAQRQRGTYYALWVDVDEPTMTFAEMVEVAGKVIPGGFMAYTSRSATEEKQKARFIVPLAEPIKGQDYQSYAKTLNRKMTEAGIPADSVTERTGQPCYLPNRGDFYDYHSTDFLGAMSPGEWVDEIAKEKAALDAQEQARKQERAKALAKAAQRVANGTASPVDAFKAEFPIPLMLDTYGYQSRGNRWLSPNSSTKSPGVSITPDGLRWISQHGSDEAAGIGRSMQGGGCSGDAFDLYCFYEHGNDFDAAVRAAGVMFKTPEGVTISKHNQREYMKAKAGESAAADFDAIPEGSWVDASGGEGRKQCQDASQACGGNSDTPPMPDPVDLFGNLEPPAFPVELMPRAIANYAQDQAALVGVDPGIIAMSAITITAACLDDRIKIQPKRNDPEWTESARFWFAPVGDPSTKKSPGITKAMGPAFKINSEWRKEADEKWGAHERKLKQWTKKSDKGEEVGPPPEPPYIKRLIYEDVTVEKMADLMARHAPRGALVYRDELTGWLSSMDAYKNGAGKDRAQWLEAYNGGHLSVDRVQRGSTFVENWSACVLGGIQPSVVHEYARVTNHDGMLQRFILLFAQKAGRGEDRAPCMDAKRRYEDLIAGVSRLESTGGVVKLSYDAHEVREALWDRLHRLTSTHPNNFLVAALGKWEGLFSRLLLAFHAADCTSRGYHPTAELVTKETAANVSKLMWSCLLPHAVKFYQELDEIEDKARAVAGLLLARGWERFTVKRDLDRYMSASRKWKPWEVDETLQRLESFGWILEPAGVKLNERGRPAAFNVNPLIHQRFAEAAEKERQRRDEVTRLMAELS